MFNRGHRALLHAISLVLLFVAPVLPALAAGTIPFSMTQQLDQYGVPLSGCQLYTIQAGTTSTPQNAYKDTALSLVQPNPMICDASGRLPQFFLADGQIKIRLLDKLGNPQVTLDNILVIGPSSGGGSGATIDSTTIAQTGDLKHAYGTQVITGWVRLNGRTIGNATSGATERANADTQALFLYLWAADTQLAVSGGRTTAAADYAANKTITLPDGRGKALASLDDMGNSVAGTYAGVSFFGGSPTTLGALVGTARRTLTPAQLPANIPNSVSSIFTPSSGTSTLYAGTVAPVATNIVGGSFAAYAQTPTSFTLGGSVASTATINAGGGSAFDTVSPYILVTTYIKL